MAHSASRAEHVRSGTANSVWLFVGLLALVALTLLTVAISTKVVFPFDRPLLAIAHGWPVSPNVWKVLSETANIPLIVIAVGYIAWLFFTKRRREALLVLLLFAAVTAGSEGLKQLTLRPRPEAGTAAGIPGVPYSYPSGHVLEALTILGSVAVRVWRTASVLVIRLAAPILVTLEVVIVAVARMALDSHYPTDILAGILGGIGALGLYVWFTRPGSWANRPPGTPLLREHPR